MEEKTKDVYIIYIRYVRKKSLIILIFLHIKFLIIKLLRDSVRRVCG